MNIRKKNNSTLEINTLVKSKQYIFGKVINNSPLLLIKMIQFKKKQSLLKKDIMLVNVIIHKTVNSTKN